MTSGYETTLIQLLWSQTGMVLNDDARQVGNPVQALKRQTSPGESTVTRV